MSIDRYYLCETLDPKTWIRFASDEFLRLDKYKDRELSNFIVSVSAGENVMLDELYYFTNEKDAWGFFENVQGGIVEHYVKGEFVACRGDLNEKQLADVRERMAESIYEGEINGERFVR